MENVLRMRLRVRWRARLIDLFNENEMKGFRCCANRFLKSKRRQRRFPVACRGRGACESARNKSQGTNILHIACKMSALAFLYNKCTCA